MKTSLNGRAALSVALLGVCFLLIAGCGGTKRVAASSGCKTAATNVAASSAGGSGSWPYSNADLANTRDAPDSTISSANVSRLRLAWAFKLTGTAAAGVGGSGVVGRESDRAGWRRLSAGSRLERVRAIAHVGGARVGVPAQRA